jgi:cyclase
VLKVRVLPTLLFKNASLVKGKSFASDRPVGSAMQAIKVYNRREVDELVFFDVSASLEGRPPDYALIDELADECFMPLTVGGGVSRVEHVRELLMVGADKVCINSGALQDQSLISEGARRFGNQCIVVGIDVRREADSWQVYSHAGTRPTGRDPVSWARDVERLGAGEIILTSIDRDGTMTGYDVDVIRLVSQAVSIPVVASGGAGDFGHMVEALREGGASAVASASIYHFTQKTPLEAKTYLKAHGFDVRI